MICNDMTPGGAGLGPCLTAAAPKAAPEVSFANEPLRRRPNACRDGQRGLLSRWVHADLRETWRRIWPTLVRRVRGF